MGLTLARGTETTENVCLGVSGRGNTKNKQQLASGWLAPTPNSRDSKLPGPRSEEGPGSPEQLQQPDMVSFLVHDTEDPVLGELGSRPWQGRKWCHCVRIQVMAASVQYRGTRRMESLMSGPHIEGRTRKPGQSLSLASLQPLANGACGQRGSQVTRAAREQSWLRVFAVCWCVRRERRPGRQSATARSQGGPCPMYNSPEKDSGLRESCPRLGPGSPGRGQSTSVKNGPTKDP